MSYEFPLTDWSMLIRAGGPESPEMRGAIARARERLEGSGRVFLRYSGTEPLLRILVEGSDSRDVSAIADELEKAARDALV